MQILLFLLLFFAAVSDAIKAKIPNVVVAIGFIAAPVLLIREDKADLLITGIICSLSVFCVLYFFFQINLIGAGDIKLLMLMPLFLDMSTLLPILFFSFGNALLLYVMKENIFSQHTSQKRGIRMSIPIFLGYGLWYLNQIF